jgi:hypothetical protein
MERAVADSAPARAKRRLRLDPSIVPGRGKPFDLTAEQIYEIIGLP